MMWSSNLTSTNANACGPCPAALDAVRDTGYYESDLVRAMAEEGVHLTTEMIWLRSYGNARTGASLSVLAAPTDHVKDKHVLLVDGVLDKGNTVMRATKLLLEAGMPKEAIALLPGRGEVIGAQLVGDARIAGVAFTGGTGTAQAINRTLASRTGPIIPFIAETGGLNAMIAAGNGLIRMPSSGSA